MTDRFALLQILADGHFHSGEVLGDRLGVTRAAIWKQLRGLESLGLNIHAVRGRGYCLAQPIEFLQTEQIRGLLAPSVRECLPLLDVFHEIDSTNTYLKTRAAQGVASGAVCLAEWQRAGRGRQGRVWVSPFGCNLYLSLLWRFAAGPASLAGLSLAVGVALVQALRDCVDADFGLKWPNDLLWRGRKLGGILVEIAGESSGPSHAIIGMGLNIRMPDDAAGEIGQPWVDLYRISREQPSRNALAAAVLNRLVAAMQAFESQGLKAFLDAWRALDVTAGKAVQLHLATETVDGHAHGIDDDGALLIRVGNDLRRYASGEISLRMTS
ncbi:MAG: bifunctional biotin--[acetyl-CoA-carboxylase] ligase/biotin operon repressor BirA [Gammaproteobacteria bacterium]|nr:bifunctional biotin--[acetyl-CoA-carboxylase] ligase/biotin operon repressor BirA [Gammaproteobacteria bacterium]